MTLSAVLARLGLDQQEVEKYCLEMLKFSRVCFETEDIAGYTEYIQEDFEYREGPVSVYEVTMEIYRVRIAKEYWEGRWAA